MYLLEMPPGGSGNIGPALRAAIASGERAIEIPRGSWTVSTVSTGLKLPAGQLIQGQGKDNTTITLDRGSSVFSAEGDGITLRDLDIDCTASTNFRSCFKSDHYDGHTITRCKLRSSLVPEDGWTIHGVVIRGASNLLIEGNSLENAQLKLGGPTTERHHNGPGVRVIGNYGVNCHNGGLSFVTTKEKSAVSSIQVIGNQFLDCYNFGVFIGTDGDHNPGLRTSNIIIKGNIITTDGSGTCTPIIVRSGNGGDGGRVLIDGNVCHGTPRTPIRGILLKSGDRYKTEWDQFIITNNVVRFCKDVGIRIRLQDGNVILANNSVKNTVNGIEVYISDGNSKRARTVDALISGNHSEGTSSALYYWAKAGLLRVHEGTNILAGRRTVRENGTGRIEIVPPT